MEFALHILMHWLLLLTGLSPLIAFFTCALASVVDDSTILAYTRPSEVPAYNPLIRIQGKEVRYLGVSEHPLPWKFRLFSSFFPVGFFPALSLVNVLQSHGVSFLSSMAIGFIAFQLPFLAAILLTFRRLQPKWINQHLASIRQLNPGSPDRRTGSIA